jgi:hypothetical protein
MATVLQEYSKNVKLCGTDFTVEWLLDSLGKNDEKFIKNFSNRKVINVKARDINGGKGMFSIVLKCELFFEDSKNENDIYTTILKIPSTDVWQAIRGDEKVEDMTLAGNPLIEKIVSMHKTECSFYDLIGKHVSEILPRVFKTQEWIPGKHQGCLHMEDLSKRGRNLDYYNSLSHGQLKNIIQRLAYLHQNVMCLDESKWKGKFLSQKRLFIEMMTTIGDYSQRFIEMSKKTSKLDENTVVVRVL